MRSAFHPNEEESSVDLRPPCVLTLRKERLAMIDVELLEVSRLKIKLVEVLNCVAERNDVVPVSIVKDNVILV